MYVRFFTCISTGNITVILSLERNSYFVNEATGFVEVCVVLNGLGEEGVITATILTKGNSATGKLK